MIWWKKCLKNVLWRGRHFKWEWIQHFLNAMLDQKKSAKFWITSIWNLVKLPRIRHQRNWQKELETLKKDNLMLSKREGNILGASRKVLQMWKRNRKGESLTYLVYIHRKTVRLTLSLIFSKCNFRMHFKLSCHISQWFFSQITWNLADGLSRDCCRARFTTFGKGQTIKFLCQVLSVKRTWDCQKNIFSTI